MKELSVVTPEKKTVFEQIKEKSAENMQKRTEMERALVEEADALRASLPKFCLRGKQFAQIDAGGTLGICCETLHEEDIQKFVNWIQNNFVRKDKSV